MAQRENAFHGWFTWYTQGLFFWAYNSLLFLLCFVCLFVLFVNWQVIIVLVQHVTKFPAYKKVFSLFWSDTGNLKVSNDSSHSCTTETIARGGQYPDPLINTMVHISPNPCIPSRCSYEVSSCTHAHRMVTSMEVTLTNCKLIVISMQTPWGYVHQLRPCEKMMF